MEQSDLAVKVDALQNLLRQRDDDCQRYMEQIADLQRTLDSHSNNIEEVRSVRQDQILFLQEENMQLSNEVRELQTQIVMLRAEKDNYAKHLARAQETQRSMRPRTLSETESENLRLRERVAELEAGQDALLKMNSQYEADLSRATAKITKYKKHLHERGNETVEKFGILQDKLHDSRSGKLDEEKNQQILDLRSELEAMTAEKESFEHTAEMLQEASDEFAKQHAEFVSTLGRFLGCEDHQEIVAKVRELSVLPAELDKLRLELANTKQMGEINQNEGYVAVVEALRQVRDHLAPNELKLPADSPFRHLFASMFNMVNAAMKPTEKKDVLLPHIRAVKLQARAFSPEGK